MKTDQIISFEKLGNREMVKGGFWIELAIAVAIALICSRYPEKCISDTGY